MSNSPLGKEQGNTRSMGNYYPALDGLRGLAILMIILYHNFDFIPAFRPTWVSLDLFFVLSGFLITGILLEKRDSVHFIKNFYGRRILRIFPIYYLSLVLFLFILPRFITYPFGIHYFIKNQSWFWLEVQNWLFILKPRDNNNFLDHFWSLALEEQFYLLSPWIIVWIKPLRKIVCFLLLMLFLIFVLRLLAWSGQFTRISYPQLYAFTRIDGLCVGSLLAVFRLQGNFEMGKWNRVLLALFFSVIFLALPCLKFFYQLKLPYLACCLYPGIAVFWGWIVWVSINPGSFIYRLFNIRPLIFFGRISYGLYIFHWPVNGILRSRYLMNSQGVSFSHHLLLAGISTATSVVLAVVSYYSYEKYFLGLKKYFN